MKTDLLMNTPFIRRFGRYAASSCHVIITVTHIKKWQRNIARCEPKEQKNETNNKLARSSFKRLTNQYEVHLFSLMVYSCQ